MKRLAIASAALWMALAAAQADTVYRCGREYTDQPCPNGRTVVVAGAATAEQRAEARQVVAREKALAAEMARDRRAEEATVRPALAGSLSAPAPAPSKEAKKHPKKRGKGMSAEDDRDFLAAAPKAKKAGN